MFCYQCEQTIGGKGCTKLVGACGKNVNGLPLTLMLSWFEQKAVAILLSLLYLGIKDMYIGPTPPAFISGNVFKVLQEKFNLKLIGEPKKDLEEALAKHGSTCST